MEVSTANSKPRAIVTMEPSIFSSVHPGRHPSRQNLVDAVINIKSQSSSPRPMDPILDRNAKALQMPNLCPLNRTWHGPLMVWMPFSGSLFARLPTFLAGSSIRVTEVALGASRGANSIAACSSYGSLDGNAVLHQLMVSVCRE